LVADRGYQVPARVWDELLSQRGVEQVLHGGVGIGDQLRPVSGVGEQLLADLGPRSFEDLITHNLIIHAIGSEPIGSEGNECP
jgi:hypothetical protein